LNDRHFLKPFTTALLNRRFFLLGASSILATAPHQAFAQKPSLSSDGYHVLKAGKAISPLLEQPDRPTSVWGYNGKTPGPTIRVKQGEKVKVRLVNNLDQPTTIHWHGVRIENSMDGTMLTQRPVKPGESFDYQFIAPDAGTYWYHTHNRTWDQLARGLYGLLIVEEPELPAYRDLNFVIDDWRLTDDGKLHLQSLGNLHDWAHAGRLGNVLTVNGKATETFQVQQGEQLRLRIVNVANSRIMQLDIADHDPVLLALDGHPVAPRKLKKTDLVLGPAQRVDLLINANQKPGTVSPIHFVSRRQKIKVATIKYTGTSPAEPVKFNPPDPLPLSMPHDGFDPATSTVVELKMTGGAMGAMRQAIVGGKMLGWRQLVEAKKVWAFNGVAGDLDKPLIRVKKGKTVRIDMVNDTAFPHAMHLHGHHFSVMARNDKPVSQRVWRDTELVYPDEKLSIAFLADNPGKWLLHCHMIEHQAAGMVTWLEVHDLERRSFN